MFDYKLVNSYLCSLLSTYHPVVQWYTILFSSPCFHFWKVLLLAPCRFILQDCTLLVRWLPLPVVWTPLSPAQSSLVKKHHSCCSLYHYIMCYANAHENETCKHWITPYCRWSFFVSWGRNSWCMWEHSLTSKDKMSFKKIQVTVNSTCKWWIVWGEKR